MAPLLDDSLRKQLITEANKMPTHIPEQRFKDLMHLHKFQQWDQLLKDLKTINDADHSAGTLGTKSLTDGIKPAQPNSFRMKGGGELHGSMH